jgi:hypothetical protein
MTLVNLVTPKAGVKHELLFNKLASGVYPSTAQTCKCYINVKRDRETNTLAYYDTECRAVKGFRAQALNKLAKL